MKQAIGFLLCVLSNFLMAQSAPNFSADRFQIILRSSPRGMFIVIEDEDNSLNKAFRKLLQEESLADYRLRLWSVGSERDDGLLQHLKSRFSLDSGFRWAFFDSQERCLAHGTDLPSGRALADQLTQFGIESPVTRLRAFVRRYPDNLDGKVALLNVFRSIAEERTRGVLGDQINQTSNDEPRQLGGPWRNRRLTEAMEAVRTEEQPVQLSQEDDTKIWLRWADEFDRLMANDQWLESDFSFDFGEEYLDRHSQIVKNIYNKRIGLVEDALRRWPSSNRLWGIWLHMFLVVGDRSVLRLVNSLSPMPDLAQGTWPPYEVKMVLLQEARRTGYWRDVRDMLWESWLQFSQRMSMVRSGLGTAAVREWGGGFGNPRTIEIQWRQLFDPLFESLLMTGDIVGAETVIYQLNENAGWEGIFDLAATVALRCELPQIAMRWKR